MTLIRWHAHFLARRQTDFLAHDCFALSLRFRDTPVYLNVLNVSLNHRDNSEEETLKNRTKVEQSV